MGYVNSISHPSKEKKKQLPVWMSSVLVINIFPSCSDFSINLLQVVKENQILHKGQRVIDTECATLADMNIFPGDKLWVADSEIHENRDIAGSLL